ncbi:MAG: zinc ribbon domain-containing protein [Clostridia bacterium]|nr:zinc ribbon domain-containing protein [Clostridia bacterium]
MNFCPICGARLESTHDFCPYCGTKIERSTQAYLQDTQGAPSYVYYQQPRPKYNLKNSIMSMAFGGAALEFSVMSFIPFLGLFMFLPAFITFCALSKKYARMHLELGYPQNGFVKAGKILSTVAIPLGVVYGLYGLMFMLMFIIVIAASY